MEMEQIEKMVIYLYVCGLDIEECCDIVGRKDLVKLFRQRLFGRV